MTLTAEDLATMAERFTQLRLNATNEEDAYQANLMCELIRLAQLGAALGREYPVLANDINKLGKH
jgi:hypothetical protein